MVLEKLTVDQVIHDYVKEVQAILQHDFIRAVVYGSYAREEYSEDSDIDIAIFTNRKAEEFYLLINEIADVTFEYNVKYGIILSPFFQNLENYERMLKAVPYYQNIQKEGMLIG